MSEVQEVNAIQIGGDHYRSKAIQPWDFIAANQLGFFEGNIIKYVTRYGIKGGVEDLRKARHYLDKLISLKENEHEQPVKPSTEDVRPALEIWQDNKAQSDGVPVDAPKPEGWLGTIALSDLERLRATARDFATIRTEFVLYQDGSRTLHQLFNTLFRVFKVRSKA